MLATKGSLMQHEARQGNAVLVVTVIIVLLIALPVMYILSVGPLICVLEAAEVDETSPYAWVAIAYIYPAAMLHETGYADWIGTYVDWWA